MITFFAGLITGIITSLVASAIAKTIKIKIVANETETITQHIWKLDEQFKLAYKTDNPEAL